tara:strand:+ start:1207 stop:1764 length:558 start_codon:yes stop_codon:yes gene_type:complete
MAFLLDGNPLPIDKPFSHKETNYPANWLRLSTKAEKEAIGITEVEDPKIYDLRFYWNDGSPREIEDIDAKDKDGNLVKDENGNQVVDKGVKSNLKQEEKIIINSLLAKYDWYVVRKVEKSIEIPTEIQNYRNELRAIYDTRIKEIDDCTDTNALVTLYGNSYDKDGNFVKMTMTQYPDDPDEKRS